MLVGCQGGQMQSSKQTIILQWDVRWEVQVLCGSVHGNRTGSRL